mgnify:CR=1 FL=1
MAKYHIRAIVELSEENPLAAELKALKTKMNSKRKQIEELQIFEMLAETDQEMADMVKRLKELTAQ